MRALRSLTRPERIVCIGKKAGFSNAEIANHLGTSETDIETLLSAAKQKIRLVMTDGQGRSEEAKSSE
jgi:DNA-directed RNA polymerase specialized sigma24 family protein